MDTDSETLCRTFHDDILSLFSVLLTWVLCKWIDQTAKFWCFLGGGGLGEVINTTSKNAQVSQQFNHSNFQVDLCVTRIENMINCFDVSRSIFYTCKNHKLFRFIISHAHHRRLPSFCVVVSRLVTMAVTSNCEQFGWPILNGLDHPASFNSTQWINNP